MPQRSNSARYLFGDRNPVIVDLNYQGTTIGPHGDTARWTYTVPTGKKAIVTATNVLLVRDVVATAAALATIYITTAAARFMNAAVINTVVGSNDRMNMGHGTILLAADVVEAHTSDGSTGGSFYYTTGARIIEYDA